MAGVHCFEPRGEQFGEVHRRDSLEVGELVPAGQPVGEHHRARVGADGGQQVGLGDGTETS